MPVEPFKNPLIAEWTRKNWKLISAFVAGALLGAFAMQRGYEGFSWAGTEYRLIKEASIPKSLSIQGRWFYETKTSGNPLQYDNLSCTSILGIADISQPPISNEFNINNATRRGCIDPDGQVIQTNVGWRSTDAAVLPDNRKIIVFLSTADPNPRLAFIDGSIPSSITGDSPDEFSGTMYYLNTQNQTYGSTTIQFCKEGTLCAQNIENQLQ